MNNKLMYHETLYCERWVSLSKIEELTAVLQGDMDSIASTNPDYHIHSSTESNFVFEYGCDFETRKGDSIGSIQKDFVIKSAHSDKRFTFSVGDRFCLCQTAFNGVSFNKSSGYSTVIGTDKFVQIEDMVRETIFDTDYFELNTLLVDGGFTETDVTNLRWELYDKIIAEVEEFIATADEVFHRLGRKHFSTEVKNDDETPLIW